MEKQYVYYIPIHWNNSLNPSSMFCLQFNIGKIMAADDLALLWARVSWPGYWPWAENNNIIIIWAENMI